MSPFRLRPTTTNPRAALTRLEWIWTVLLVGVILVTILVTLEAEVERGKRRMDRDQLSFLASTIHLGLEKRGITGPDELPMSLPLLGPGEAPLDDQGQALTGGDLGALLPEGMQMLEDPWGRAYVLVAHGPAASPKLYLASAGEDGQVEFPLDPTSEEVVEVYWRYNI